MRSKLRNDSIQGLDMAKKSKKSPPRKRPVKRKTKAKAVKRAKAVPARKKTVRRKAKKPESTLEKIENAFEAGVAEFDDVAASLGLIASSSPPRRKKKSRR